MKLNISRKWYEKNILKYKHLKCVLIYSTWVNVPSYIPPLTNTHYSRHLFPLNMNQFEIYLVVLCPACYSCHHSSSVQHISISLFSCLLNWLTKEYLWSLEGVKRFLDKESEGNEEGDKIMRGSQSGKKHACWIGRWSVWGISWMKTQWGSKQHHY